MKKRLLLLFSLLLYFGAFAETLDECQRLAEQNYPLVKRYDLIRQTTDYTVANLNRGWLPQIA
ncbi:MAG: transporter, partial [Bacteroidales bacterium]|nr:transporter [Bacteroidales bacterium]